MTLRHLDMFFGCPSDCACGFWGVLVTDCNVQEYPTHSEMVPPHMSLKPLSSNRVLTDPSGYIHATRGLAWNKRQRKLQVTVVRTL